MRDLLEKINSKKVGTNEIEKLALYIGGPGTVRDEAKVVRILRKRIIRLNGRGECFFSKAD